MYNKKTLLFITFILLCQISLPAVSDENWNGTVLFNGAKFAKTKDSCVSNPNVQIKKMAAYVKSIDYKESNGDLDFTGRGLYDINGDFDFDLYYTGVWANKKYLQFWHNYVTFDMNKDASVKASIGNSGYTYPISMSATCNEYNKCTLETTAYLTNGDFYGKSTSDFLDKVNNAKGFVALRGFYLSHSGTSRKFRDANIEVKLTDTEVDSSGRLPLTITVDFNGKNTPKEMWARIYFVIGVYDPDYVAYTTMPAVDDESWSKNGNNRYLYSTQNVRLPWSDSNYGDIDCDDGCKTKQLPMFAALRSWGINLDDQYEVKRVRGIGRLESFEDKSGSDTVSVKYMGEMFRKDCATTSEVVKKANEMRARVIFCRSTDVCKARYDNFGYQEIDEELNAEFTLPENIREVRDKEPYRVGLNFITPRHPMNTTQDILDDMEELGAQGGRQWAANDLSWFTIYTCGENGNIGDPNCYAFDEPDKVFKNNHPVYPMPTLFQIGDAIQGDYFDVDCNEKDDADDCGDDCGDHKQKYCDVPYTPRGDKLKKLYKNDIEQDVIDYISVVANRYSPYGVRHWEIGNEWGYWFNHWDGIWNTNFEYKPEKYVDLLKLSRDTLKEINPNNLIVMGGLFYEELESRRRNVGESWLRKVLKKGGGHYIDVINIHYYGKWQDMAEYIQAFKDIMDEQDVSKPLWLTEVGNSKAKSDDLSDISVQKELAKDVFRFFSIAFGKNIKLVNWQAHVTSNAEEYVGTYGLGGKLETWYSFQLFSQKLGNFDDVSKIKVANNVWAYKYSGQLYEDGPTMPDRYVLWTSADSKSVDLSEYFGDNKTLLVTETVRDGNNFHSWTQSSNSSVALSNTAVIVEISNVQKANQKVNIDELKEIKRVPIH